MDNFQEVNTRVRHLREALSELLTYPEGEYLLNNVLFLTGNIEALAEDIYMEKLNERNRSANIN